MANKLYFNGYEYNEVDKCNIESDRRKELEKLGGYVVLIINGQPGLMVDGKYYVQGERLMGGRYTREDLKNRPRVERFQRPVREMTGGVRVEVTSFWKRLRK